MSQLFISRMPKMRATYFFPACFLPLSIYRNIFHSPIYLLFIYLVLKKKKKILWIVKGGIKKPE